MVWAMRTISVVAAISMLRCVVTVRREELDVAVLDVPPVAAEVHGDALRAGELAEHRRGDRIRLVGLARFADRGDVIDVDCQTHALRLAVCMRAS